MYYLQGNQEIGMQAQRVLFNFQFTGSKLFTFLYVMMNFNSPLKHNFTQITLTIILKGFLILKKYEFVTKIPNVIHQKFEKHLRFSIEYNLW